LLDCLADVFIIYKVNLLDNKKASCLYCQQLK
jgi:hypothetical protein